MTTLKKLKTALNFVKRNNRRLVNSVLSTKGKLYLTDFETTVLINEDFKLKEGYHNYSTLGDVGPAINFCEDTDNYPLERFDFDLKTLNTLVIKKKELKEFISYSSKDETRIMLNGVAVNDGYLVATNGHVLKHKELMGVDECNIILPSSSLNILIKLITRFKCDDTIEIHYNEDYSIFRCKEFKWKCLNIKREFPRWRAVVPKKFKGAFTINNWPSFKVLKPLVNKRSHACSFKSEKGIVTLKCIESGETFEVGTSKHDFEIGFNAKYLELPFSEGEQVVNFNNELSPVLIGNSIIMPLKI